MLVTAAAIGGISVVWSSSRRGQVLGAAAAIIIVQPLLGIACIAGVIVAARVSRIRRMRVAASRSDDDGLLAVELVGLGVTAGLPFRSAAALTAQQIGGRVGGEISSGLRDLDAGLPASVSRADIRSMFDAAASSETTGMPLAGTLNSIARERRRGAAAAAREQLGKLPIKMLFPLAFLILPGFVLLTVVPPLVSGLSRLGL
ncbi:MAG: type II secretion system F family protein [Actinomycetota bacterium]|nr:type II secretion system F family protein [Actinomycetota bacterium]